MSKQSIWGIVVAVVVVVAVVLVVVLVPAKTSSPTNSNTLSAAQKTADSKTVETNFKTFFAINTTMSQRESLLQNGSQFAQPMTAEFTQLVNEKPSVTVNSVTFTNKTTAKVIYTVDINGQPVLKNQTGQSVLVNNTWKVGDSTLCQLLSLGGSTPAVCKNVS